MNIHKGEKLTFNIENGKVSIEAVKITEPKKIDISSNVEEIISLKVNVKEPPKAPMVLKNLQH
ncbi:hypothetical protein ACUW90_002350 [Staphylococcus simulans]